MALMSLCLAAKGSQVSLPFLLLLLDYWPLARLRFGRGEGGETFGALVIEKLPLFALSLAAIAYQYAAVANAYNPWNADLAFFDRVQNGIMTYVATLGRLIWPTGLSIVYPTPVQMGLPPAGAAQVGVALAALVGVTAFAAAAGQRRGYLIVGWLWFLGMLLPMIGLLPSGLRVMHDRYAYVPMIGLAVAISFGMADGLTRLRAPRPLVAGAAAAVLAVYAVLSWHQASVWRDSLTLFDHALAVTDRNAIVRFFRGNALAAQGEMDGALSEYESALAIHPEYPGVNNNLGRLHLGQGRASVAVDYFQRALDARPDWTEAMINLGNALWQSGERARAIEAFEAAVASAPESADAHYGLAASQLARGRRAAAVASYREALRLDPRHEGARRALARLREPYPQARSSP
jgi:tetratricopeptide (TPR) repeat protein